MVEDEVQFTAAVNTREGMHVLICQVNQPNNDTSVMVATFQTLVLLAGAT